MKRIGFILLLLLGIFSRAAAQEVTGRVLSPEGEPIPYASVALYNQDSLFVKGGLTDSLGIFRLEYDKMPFWIEVRHVSYQRASRKCTALACGDIQLPALEQELAAVVVSGGKPALKIGTEGALVYSGAALRGSMLVTTALDMVRKLPGMVEQNGSLNLVGSMGMAFVINGKRSIWI